MVITANDLDGNAGNISITYIHDAVVPTFGSYFVEYSSLKANTRLSFSASEPIQPTSLVFEAAGCTLANPTYISQTLLTVNVVSCEDQGDFALTLSAADTVGNVGTATFNYVIDSVAPTITTVYPPPMNLIFRNTAITLSTSEAIRVKNTLFVATGCSFTPPTWTGTVVSTTVLSCPQGGVNLTVFVTDLVGNVGTFTVPYSYPSADVMTPLVNMANTKIKIGGSVSTTANRDLLNGASTTAPGCTFQTFTNGDDNRYVFNTLLGCDKQGPFIMTLSVTDTNNSPITYKIGYVFDSISPSFTPSLAANAAVTANTLLAVTSNEDARFDTIVAPGCAVGNVNGYGSRLTTFTLYNCTTEGSISLNFSAKDTAGNIGSLVINYVYDSVGPTFTPHIAANTTVTANTLLSFTTNEPILSSATLEAEGCVTSSLIVIDQTITAKLACSTSGPFTLTLTALDTLGNAGTHVMDYVYEALSLHPALVANTTVTVNSQLSFTANRQLQKTGTSLVASGCTFDSLTVTEFTISATLVAMWKEASC